MRRQRTKPTNKFQFVRLHFKFCYHFCWNGHCISEEEKKTGEKNANVHNQSIKIHKNKRKEKKKKFENGNTKRASNNLAKENVIPTDRHENI